MMARADRIRFIAGNPLTSLYPCTGRLKKTISCPSQSQPLGSLLAIRARSRGSQRLQEDMMARKNHAVDRHLGARVRFARIEKRISQGALGEQLGISFQQVQKYELGKDRISASQLMNIARILEKDISFFFEDITPEGETSGDDRAGRHRRPPEALARQRDLRRQDHPHPAFDRRRARQAEAVQPDGGDRGLEGPSSRARGAAPRRERAVPAAEARAPVAGSSDGRPAADISAAGPIGRWRLRKGSNLRPAA